MEKEEEEEEEAAEIWEAAWGKASEASFCADKHTQQLQQVP